MSIRKPDKTASSCTVLPTMNLDVTQYLLGVRGSVVAKHIEVVVTSNGI